MEALAKVKQLKPHFEPQRSGKAFYSDINFDILGEIIVKISGQPLARCFQQRIIGPLGLTRTYLPENEGDMIPAIYYKNQLIQRPKFLVSSGASGGAVTTTHELMIFLKAFFGGSLFDKNNFGGLSTYNPLQMSMTPISYGGGFMQISLEGITTLFRGRGELLGHSGTTGSFAFYYPHKDLFYVGDLNQMADPSLPLRFAMQLALARK